MSVFNQIFSTLILCFIYMIMGMMFTWPSSVITTFSSPATTLHRPMSEGELALLGSLSSMGGLVSTPLAGIYLDRLGRKPCSIISALMNMIGWSMIAFSNRVEIILAASFIGGLTGGIFLIFTTFISEIYPESIRGTMTSGILSFYNIGMLVSYLFAGYLSYGVVVNINLTMSAVGVVGLFVLKESPLFLMSQGMEHEASESIAFYRNVRIDSKEVLRELDNIKRALNPDIDDEYETALEEKKLQTEHPQKLSLIQFIKKSRSTRRAIVITLTLMTAAVFQGLPVLQVYAEPLFAEAVPVMTANLCSVIFATINIVVGFVGAYLIDTAGRRPLVIYGSIGSGLSCVLLASQVHSKWGPNWVTAAAIYLFCTVYSAGVGNVPYVVIGEVFLPEVKSFISMLVIEWAFLCYFLILVIFNPLVSALGLGPVFYIFAGVCLATAAFAYLWLPETKSLPVDAIQQLFVAKRKKVNV